jgi:hypothetical protein
VRKLGFESVLESVLVSVLASALVDFLASIQPKDGEISDTCAETSVCVF